MRTQSGTTSLRSILYIDEVFGYLPPVANPPSKLPLLTLLKQARAFGLGVLLATQNPIDLDYKALSNAGTWFLGRLQTERDKERVLDGLEGAAVAGQKQFNRRYFDQVLSGLGNRVFLMNNVHEDAPAVFETRWAMSYLRGPLTREQIKILVEPLKKQRVGLAPARTQKLGVLESAAASSVASRSGEKPMVPPDVQEYFLPLDRSKEGTPKLVYLPMIVGAAQVGFNDRKAGVNMAKEMVFLIPVTDSPMPVDWDSAKEASIKVSDLESSTSGDFAYGELPSAALKAKNYGVWEKDFENWLVRTQKIQLFKSTYLNELSRPEETERDFRIRLQQISREKRDLQVEKIREKYSSAFSRLDERVRKAKMNLENQRAQAKSQKVQVAVSIGETLLSSFLGRKSNTRATRSAREIARQRKEAKDQENAEDNLKALEKERAQLEKKFQSEINLNETKSNSLTEDLAKVFISPSKADVTVRLLALAWTL
jgi:hypothetical protein